MSHITLGDEQEMSGKLEAMFPELRHKKGAAFSSFLLPCSLFWDYCYLSLSEMLACWGMFIIACSGAWAHFKRHEGHSFPLVSFFPFSGL